MAKISLISRRKDKYFDQPTKASQRAHERAEQENSGKDAEKDREPDVENISVSKEDGMSTVEVQVPDDTAQKIEKVSKDILGDKDRAEAVTEISKTKIGDKWELKLQFMPGQTSKMLTSKQLAEMLRVGVHTIYSLHKKGIIKGYKVGRGFRYSWAEVAEALSKDK